MNTAMATSQSLESRQCDANLDRRYKRIGISAVVAALAYRSDTKNAVNAPAETRD